MFLSNPRLRDMFPIQMDVQRNRLLGAIVSTVQNFDDPERIDAYLRGLGRDHRKFHVEPEHYRQVKDALLEALRRFAGDGWNSRYEQAWNDVYDLIAATMIAGAEADNNPPYWYAEVESHERRGPDIAVFTCRPLHPIKFRAGQYVSIECKLSAAAVAHVLDGEHGAAGCSHGVDDARPEVQARHRLRRRRYGSRAGQGAHRRVGRLQPDPLVYLFRGVRHRDEPYDRGGPDAPGGRYPWLNLVRAVSDDPDFRDGEHGDISDVVCRHGPWNEHDFYVSGSAPMVDATLRGLAELRVPQTRIRYDAFTEA